MAQEEWLLLGGPINGQIASVAAGSPSVLAPDSDGAVVEYKSTIYVLDGFAYVVGVCADHHPPTEGVGHAIRESGVKPNEVYSSVVPARVEG
jgi:hypothetical protein